MSRNSEAKRNEQILTELLKDEANRQCADCRQKGTRWASWNIGVFLCIRCGGLHRKLGTHISKVKSVTLDSWTDEEIQSIRTKGNAKVNAIYNPDPERFAFPSYSGYPSPDVRQLLPVSSDMEQFIRDKYERKLFMASNQSHACPGAPMRLGREQPRETFPFEYREELSQLQEMGFKNSARNILALKTAGGSVIDSIDILAAQATPPERKHDPYSDFLSADLQNLQIDTAVGQSSAHLDAGNDWGDLEMPKKEALSLSEIPAALDSAPLASPKPVFIDDAWGKSATESPDLGSDLTSSKFFHDDDENDPFRELTHNPFK